MLENISFSFYRERRIKFETHLIKEKTKMEAFRLRETKEFLSLDELEEKCNISDNFMEILRVQTAYSNDNTFFLLLITARHPA